MSLWALVSWLRRGCTVEAGLQLTAQADHFDFLVRSGFVTLSRMHRLESLLGIAIGPSCPDGEDDFQQVFISRGASHQCFKVMAVVGEETRDQLAIRGQPGSRTAEAERFRDRGDHAYISASVRELEIHGGSALLIPARQSQRIPGLDHFQNFLLGNHPAGLPLVRVATSIYSMKRMANPFCLENSTRS